MAFNIVTKIKSSGPLPGAVSLTGNIFDDPNTSISYRENVERLFNAVFTTKAQKDSAYAAIAHSSSTTHEKDAHKNFHLLATILGDTIISELQQGRLDSHPKAKEIKDLAFEIFENNPGAYLHRQFLEIARDGQKTGKTFLDDFYAQGGKTITGSLLRDVQMKFEIKRKLAEGTILEPFESAFLTKVSGNLNVTDKEMKFVRKLEGGDVPNGFWENWSDRRKGQKDDRNKFTTVLGKYLSPRSGRRKVKIYNPLTGKFEYIDVSRATLVDGKGKLNRDALRLHTTTAYEQDRVRQNREDAKAMFEQSGIFGQIQQKMGGKVSEFAALHAFDEEELGGGFASTTNKGKELWELSEDKKKKGKIWQLYFGSKEGRERFGILTGEIGKHMSIMYSNSLHKYYHNNPPLDARGKPYTTGKANFIAAYRGFLERQKMPIFMTDQMIGDLYDNKCFVNGKFDGWRAIMLTNGMDPDLIAYDPHGKAITEEDFVQRLVDNYIIGIGSNEVRAPLKDLANEKIIGAISDEIAGYIQLKNRGIEIDKEGREALGAWARGLYRHMGKKMFSGNGTIDAQLDDYEFIDGILDTRVKVLHANGQTNYLDPTEFIEATIHSYTVNAALRLQQEQRFFGSNPMLWWTHQVANTGMNIMEEVTPGVKSLVKFGQDVVKGKWMQLSLPEQKKYNLESLEKSVGEYIKKTLFEPVFAYDPLSGQIVPRTRFLLSQSIGYGMDFLTGSETSEGFFDKLAGFYQNKILKDDIYVWSYDKATNEYKRTKWQPRILQGITRSKRQKQTLLEIAFRMGAGLVFQGIVAPAIGQVKALARLSANLKYYTQEYPRSFIQKHFSLAQNNFLQRAWAGVKATVGVGQAVFKSTAKSIIPAVAAGVAFNSPVALIVIGGTALSANLVQEIAIATAGNDILTEIKFLGLGDSLVTMSKVFTLQRNAINTVFPQTAPNLDAIGGKMPQMFGFKMYKQLPDGSFIRKVNLADVRGFRAGIGRASLIAPVVYAITGNAFLTAFAAAGTVIGSMAVERIAIQIAERLTEIRGVINGLGEVVKFTEGVLISGVSIYTGLQFLKETFDAFRQSVINGDDRALRKYVDTYWGGALPAISTITTAYSFVMGVKGLYLSATSLGQFITSQLTARGFQIASTLNLSGWTIGGMIIGGIIGYLVGGTMGAMAGGAVGGALGGTIGAVIGSAIPVIGTFVGWLIGTTIGGFVGGKVGAWIENKVGGALNSVTGLAKTLGGMMNLIQSIKLLFSANIGDVAVGAFMIAISGMVSLAALQDSQMSAASYIVSEGSDLYTSGLSFATVPTTIQDFEKSIQYNGFTDNTKSIIYNIHVTNADEENRSITTYFTDELNTGSSEMQSAIDVEILSDDSVSESRSGNTITLKQSERTVAVGESNDLSIKFTVNTRTFPEWIADMESEKLCNTAKILGTIDGGDTLNYSDTICIDKDGNITGPGGKCPIGDISFGIFTNNPLTGKACHPESAIDFNISGNIPIYAPVEGTVTIRNPKQLTEGGRTSITGCYDGGYTIDIKGVDGRQYGIWHIRFDNYSFEHYTVNGKELKNGTTVKEGQLIGWAWDGAVGNPTLDTCYQNPGGRYNVCGGLYGTCTWWGGPHIHFAIYGSTPPCQSTIDFIKENCGSANNYWNNDPNY